MRGVFSTILAAVTLATVIARSHPCQAADDAGVEFFEKRIRPLLAENCYQCHGPKKQESGLALSNISDLQTGGDRGPPLSPGEPEQSLLIKAIRYTDDDLKMPPRGKLSAAQIADLVEWVRIGAPVPRAADASNATIQPLDEFDLAERRQHWAYQPIQIPALPATRLAGWCRSPIDRFIVARLESAEQSPAAEASRRALMRRASFDLTGLPPAPAAVADFLADLSPDAYERLIDRLLASPQYGERWARHWLDVVRYSETLGFEFDYDLHNAWRYRDYVIRAFNADLPYDQFVVEHLAGDLVPEPRWDSLDGTNESILATGFFWMHEGKQTPVDIRQDQADRIDNQIDVLGKAFLGQTIACARCHDHKFDAISTRDYYALAGYLRSSRYQQAFVDPPNHRAGLIAELTALRAKIDRVIRVPIAKAWREQASQATSYLMAAARAQGKDETTIEETSRAAGLEPAHIKRWIKALSHESLASPEHPLHLWRELSKSSAVAGESFPLVAATLLAKFSQQSEAAARIVQRAELFEDFSQSSTENWFFTGDAFGGSPALAGLPVIGDSPQRPIARLTSGGLDSGLVSKRLQGELRSPSFTINKNFIHLRLAGRNARVNLVIDGYTLIMNPMYGKLTATQSSDLPTWYTMPVDRWLGHRAFFEACDSTIPMFGLNPPPSPAREPRSADGYLVLDRLLLSDDPLPPTEPNSVNVAVLKQISQDSDGSDVLAALATAYQQMLVTAIEEWCSAKAKQSTVTEDQVALINWFLENGFLDHESDSAGQQTTDDDSPVDLLAQYHAHESTMPLPQRAPAIADGTGEDEFVFLRGNWRTPGPRALRNAPEVINFTGAAPQAKGHAFEKPSDANERSGRLNLARKLVGPQNPLLPRVLVNRLWQHHFGEGIVRTPDDFGRMGQPPSHPELLDHLAAELVKADWSVKTLHRRLVTTSTYQMSSRADSASRSPEVDPTNLLLWRQNVRRLEAEAIRDSLLAVSGRLSNQLHGPSVLPFLTPYMEGRGKPQSGPLDGEGRRSIYLNARRNFLTPLLLAFDYPVTFTPIGRRGTATIPAQALTLMNDPLIVSEATRWAEQSLAATSGTEQRIDALYQSAFARLPSTDERNAAIDFLQSQSLRRGVGSEDAQVWADLCHVLVNTKEFIFIE